jgi:AhpD family alkylhydroperoxidase
VTQPDPIERHDPTFVAEFDTLYAKTWGDGVIPEKYKQLSGVSISVVQRCDPCLAWHAREAARLGATHAELVEALRLGLLTGGSITIPTVRKAYELIDTLKLR